MRRFRIWVIRIGSTLLGAIALLSLVGAAFPMEWHVGTNETIRFDGRGYSHRYSFTRCAVERGVGYFDIGILTGIPTLIALASNPP